MFSPKSFQEQRKLTFSRLYIFSLHLSLPLLGPRAQKCLRIGANRPITRRKRIVRVLGSKVGELRDISLIERKIAPAQAAASLLGSILTMEVHKSMKYSYT